jgi:hypothetical protein
VKIDLFLETSCERASERDSKGGWGQWRPLHRPLGNSRENLAPPRFTRAAFSKEKGNEASSKTRNIVVTLADYSDS